MTLPYEEVRTMKETRKFLVELMTRKPAAPKWIRQRASSLLKHFPWEFQGVSLIPMDDLYIGFEEKTYAKAQKRYDEMVANTGKKIIKKYKKALKKLKD